MRPEWPILRYGVCGDQRRFITTTANQQTTTAGVDLGELVKISTSDAHKIQFLVDLKEAFASFSKPLIAAVVGFAVGSVKDMAFHSS
jgi:enoyl-CoA hydratase